MLPAHLMLLSPANDPTKAGQLARKKQLFGFCHRYAVFPIHTRFDSVDWLIADAEQLDDETGLARVIFQSCDTVTLVDVVCKLWGDEPNDYPDDWDGFEYAPTDPDRERFCSD